MARMFTQIIDSRFTAGTEEELKVKLAARVDDIRKALRDLGGVNLASSQPRLLRWKADGTLQWRSDCWVYKHSNLISWDDVCAVVNSIEPVKYESVSDTEALHQIRTLMATSCESRPKEAHHETAPA